MSRLRRRLNVLHEHLIHLMLGRITIFGPPPDWAGLHAIGQSPAVKLTILTPFIGSLIVFNSGLVDLLALSPIALAPSNDGTLIRLKLIYFGLLGVGVGAFLFSIYCPNDLKRTPTLSEFVAVQLPLVTKARMRSILTSVVKSHIQHVMDGNLESPASRRIYPWLQIRLFEDAITEVASQMDWGEDGQKLGFVMAHGGHSIDAIVELLNRQPLAGRHFVSEFNERATAQAVDFLSLLHGDLVRSAEWVRSAVFHCFLIGFTLLTIPTLLTIYAIISKGLT